MTEASTPDLVSSLRQYRARIIWGCLVVIGLALPYLDLGILMKSGEGYEFHNVMIMIYLILAWFLITIIVAYRGAPLRWTLSIGAAPTGLLMIDRFRDTASYYAGEGQNFWLLVVTGDEQAIASLVRDVDVLLQLGIPLAILAYVIGCTTDHYLGSNRGERISTRSLILLLGIAMISAFIGW